MSFFTSTFPSALQPIILLLEAIEEAPGLAALDEISKFPVTLRPLYLRLEIFGEAYGSAVLDELVNLSASFDSAVFHVIARRVLILQYLRSQLTSMYVNIHSQKHFSILQRSFFIFHPLFHS